MSAPEIGKTADFVILVLVENFTYVNFTYIVRTRRFLSYCNIFGPE